MLCASHYILSHVKWVPVTKTLSALYYIINVYSSYLWKFVFQLFYSLYFNNIYTILLCVI